MNYILDNGMLECEFNRCVYGDVFLSRRARMLPRDSYALPIIEAFDSSFHFALMQHAIF